MELKANLIRPRPWRIGVDCDNVINNLAESIIDVYNMQLREITRFYRQVRTAAYVPTHDDEKWNCIFPDGEAPLFRSSASIGLSPFISNT